MIGNYNIYNLVGEAFNFPALSKGKKSHRSIIRIFLIKLTDDSKSVPIYPFTSIPSSTPSTFPIPCKSKKVDVFRPLLGEGGPMKAPGPHNDRKCYYQ